MQRASGGPRVVNINGRSVVGCCIPGTNEIVYGMIGEIVGGVITTLDCPAMKQGLCGKNIIYKCPKANLQRFRSSTY